MPMFVCSAVSHLRFGLPTCAAARPVVRFPPKGYSDPASHERQHEVATCQRAFPVGARGVHRRPFRERRQHRPFGDRDILDTLAEQVAARRLHAVHPVAEVDDVEVERQDLILREALLDEAREPELHELPPHGARPHEMLGDERVPRDLHRDRAEAFTHAEGTDVTSAGPQEAAPIEPVVVVEAPILCREERLTHVFRDLLDRNVDPADHRQPAHEPALPVEDLAALGRPERANLPGRGAAVEATCAEPHIHGADAQDGQRESSKPGPLRAKPTTGRDIWIGSHSLPKQARAIPDKRRNGQRRQPCNVSHMTPRPFCKVSTPAVGEQVRFFMSHRAFRCKISARSSTPLPPAVALR